MRSEAQIRASRLNGAKSRGPCPKTAGLSARTVVLCNENDALFEQLERNFIDALKPVNLLELFLIQRMAAAQWRIHRACAIATALFDANLIQNRRQDEAENPELDQDLRLALAHKRIAKDLATVQQTEDRMERSLDRALATFHRLRKVRPSDAQPIEPPPPASPPPVGTLRSTFFPSQRRPQSLKRRQCKRLQRSRPNPQLIRNPSTNPNPAEIQCVFSRSGRWAITCSLVN